MCKDLSIYPILLEIVAFSFVTLLLTAWVAKIAWSIIKWKTYIWLPSLFWAIPFRERVVDQEQHLIFTMIDHYEPGYGERGVKKNEEWLNAFRPISDSHRDSAGNRFRYTWFYPYDHKNEKVLIALSRMAYDGYGEVELHWHHPPADDVTFPAMLQEALTWFQQYGALISSGAEPRTRFAFVHGNWALDNSLPICGVNHELDILFRHGCYADFTFSSIGTYAQPRKVNAIYYPRNCDGPKSYDDGVDVEVGVSVEDRPMIFQGPIGLNWLTGRLEYGAIESFALPHRSRIQRWIDTNIHVKGRPEWVFVKVYSHGMQSANAIVHKALNRMLNDIKDICEKRQITLHYMTAREAYNIVKAAEDGKTGNPEAFRNYRVAKPCNMLFYTDVPVLIEHVTETEVVYRLKSNGSPDTFCREQAL